MIDITIAEYEVFDWNFGSSNLYIYLYDAFTATLIFLELWDPGSAMRLVDGPSGPRTVIAIPNNELHEENS